MRGGAGPLLNAPMTDKRLAAGVERIERALARIAAAATDKAPAAEPVAGDNGELAALRAKHDGLKAEVARALDDLDGLVRG